MLLEDIRKRMLAAMKAGNTVEKEILRVAVGEITTAAGRTGRDASEAEITAIIRKLLKSNEETLPSARSDEERQTLLQEQEILRSLVPQTLGVDQIAERLAPVADAIRAAKSDGQATGIAMKELKQQGALVEGKDVGQAVAQLRAP